jgi:hypothetical protein
VSKIIGEEMDIKGLRTLNHIGVFLFRLIGCIIPLPLLVGSIFFRSYVVMSIAIIWIILILITAEILFRFTVVGIDRGNYGSAKFWTLIGIFVGIAGGIIPIIIFIISYVSFDEAIRTQIYGPHYYGYYQQPSSIKNCNGCRRQIPFDSKLCPYCGVQQIPMRPYNQPPPLKTEVSHPAEKQHRIPPPPPK